jgi:uncharacterized protein
MRKLIMTVATVVIAGSLFSADTKDMALRKQRAEKLLIQMEVPQAMTKAFNMITRMQAAQMSKMGMSQAQQAKAVKIQKETMTLIRKELAWNKIKPSIVTAYAETFTADDLKVMNEFYATPVGKKFIKKQPELQQRMMMTQMTMMRNIMPKIKAIVEKYRK